MNTTNPNPSQSDALNEFSQRIRQHSLVPLWEVLSTLVHVEPKTLTQPAIWQYKTVRDYLYESGALISAEEAERRVLVLENPGLKGMSSISEALYAGIQMVLPGEVAPAHRHVSAALRFIIEGEKAYTAVNGEKLWMKEGDLVLTPNWTWHDHHHDGDEPIFWLDGLDAPLVRYLSTSFMEKYPESSYPTDPQVNSSNLYGNNMLPYGFFPSNLKPTVLHFPYDRTRETLYELQKIGKEDPHFGVKMEYINPSTGSAAMPTLSTHCQLLSKGQETVKYQTTDSSVYSVVEGKGSVSIGDTKFAFGPKDHFVVPSWYPHSFKADEETVLFSFSDKIVQTCLGLWREKRSEA